MKTLSEVSAELKIPARHLRKLEARGYLLFAPEESEPLDRIIARMKTGAPLTAEHLRFLILNPSALDSLDKWEDMARRQLRLLGDAPAEAIPLERHPHNLIVNCALKDDAAADELAAWIASVIPVTGCGYHYVAVRAILNVPEALFETVYRQLSRSIYLARQRPALAGMSGKDKRSTKFHQRKELDL